MSFEQAQEEMDGVARSLVVGISASDPLAMLASRYLLAVVALVASYAPARRATRVDPAVALRSE